jgi:hypothetical protein
MTKHGYIDIIRLKSTTVPAARAHQTRTGVPAGNSPTHPPRRDDARLRDG